MTGILQVVHEPSSDVAIVGVEHVLIGGLSVLLVAQLPFLYWLGSQTKTWPVFVAALGMVPLAAVATVSNVQGEDPAYFAAIAAPANLLWLGGLVALAVASKRFTRLPRPLTIALPITWVGTIPLSSFGGGVLVAAFWAAAAWVIFAEDDAEADA
ncbi:hypothetical protein [Nocardioides sp. SYSU D00065]|uniref:hypothetical protein n=1 Tax=Nocardioides sp. SYSU D00065 TaxID=2817378 RepID=UPI001B342142|nr:hypothetical protein [Nocardioides sp. SYSU D00065]